TANKGNEYIDYYFLYDLKMTYQVRGDITANGQGIIFIMTLLFGYALGSMTDRLKPLRVIPYLFMMRALVLLVAFYTVHDQFTATVYTTANQFVVVLFGIAAGAATVELFPMEKIGQFCSAQSFFFQTLLLPVYPFLIAPFFDRIKYNRFGFIWGAFFNCLAGFVAIKVYYNWKRKRRLEAAAAA
ncbi:MAG: hypothetical protein WCI73_17815, partial [Phycisphaerae bacterium]